MIKVFISTILLQLALSAHTLIFDTVDNEDGTMEVVGMFSTGASAQGANLKVISLATDKVIYEKRLPASGSLTIDIPKEAYKLILDSGPGHRLEKVGVIEPEDGFKQISSKKINVAFYTTLAICIFFITLAFLIQFLRIKRSQVL